MQLEPCNEWVLVARDGKSSRTRGGLIIPDRSRDVPDRGEVVAVGPGRVMPSGHVEPPAVAPGDVVAFSPYSGHDFTIDGTAILLIKETDILAALPSETP